MKTNVRNQNILHILTFFLSPFAERIFSLSPFVAFHDLLSWLAFLSVSHIGCVYFISMHRGRECPGTLWSSYAGATPPCLWLIECFFGPGIFFGCFACVCGSSVQSAKNNTAHSNAALETWRQSHDSSSAGSWGCTACCSRAAALGTRSCCWHPSLLGSLSWANPPLGHALLLPWRKSLSFSRMEPESKLVWEWNQEWL